MRRFPSFPLRRGARDDGMIARFATRVAPRGPPERRVAPSSLPVRRPVSFLGPTRTSLGAGTRRSGVLHLADQAHRWLDAPGRSMHPGPEPEVQGPLHAPVRLAGRPGRSSVVSGGARRANPPSGAPPGRSDGAGEVPRSRIRSVRVHRRCCQRQCSLMAVTSGEPEAAPLPSASSRLRLPLAPEDVRTAGRADPPEIRGAGPLVLAWLVPTMRPRSAEVNPPTRNPQPRPQDPREIPSTTRVVDSSTHSPSPTDGPVTPWS